MELDIFVRRSDKLSSGYFGSELRVGTASYLGSAASEEFVRSRYTANQKPLVLLSGAERSC